MSNCNCGCDCDGGVKLIYSCSGAANTGYLADAVSRRLMRNGAGKMTCLAGVGGGISGFIESAKCAQNIVIDGCPVGCGKKIFENAGLPFTQILLTDYGVEKGKTEITEELINTVTMEVTRKI